MPALSKLAFAASATAAVTSVAAQPVPGKHEQDPLYGRFRKFMDDYNRTYPTMDEEQKRFSVFKENLAKASVMSEAAEGRAKFGVNTFSDLTADEFKARYLGSQRNPQTERKREELKEAARAEGKTGALERKIVKTRPAETIDWTGKLTTPVKNQAQCGSCWAFSATEQIETGLAMANGGKLVDLSPQQIVSCDTKGQDMGCMGGFSTGAYQYVEGAGGLDTAKEYPYTSQEGNSGTCKNARVKVGNFAAKVDSFKFISQNGQDEDAMFTQIATSPMSICVNAMAWQTYQGGVMTAKACGDPTELDHCVQVVGYDKDSDAWKVRNSWTTQWGEDGFIRVAAGEDACGVAQDATTVKVTPLNEESEL